jgi:myosin heavy subunit
MSYIPSATAQRVPPKKDNRGTIIGILLFVIFGLVGYIIYDKVQDAKLTDSLTSTEKSLAATKIDYQNLDSAKNILQAQYDIAVNKIDTLSTVNVQLNQALQQRNSDIAKKKEYIKSILSKTNASEAELKEAQQKIAELNGEIESYVTEINKLKQENQQLTTDKNNLTVEKDQLTIEKKQLSSEKKNLEEKVDVASTLSASNINITAIKMSGSKEKTTERASKADFFRLSFVIDENRVAPSGNKQIYVVVKTPDGKTSASHGTFKTREGSEIQYTETIPVNYEQGKVIPVSFDWKPGSEFIAGDYRIEIYNNGFKIGETVKPLKKGGFLGL